MLMDQKALQTQSSPSYDSGGLELLTREDLRSELKALYSELHASISGLLLPLKDDICHELQNIYSKLQIESSGGVGHGANNAVAHVAGSSSMVSHDLERIIRDEMDERGMKRHSISDDMDEKNKKSHSSVDSVVHIASEDRDVCAMCDTSIERSVATESAKFVPVGNCIMPPQPPVAPEDSLKLYDPSSSQDTFFNEPLRQVRANDVVVQEVVEDSTGSTTVRFEDKFVVPGTVNTRYNTWSTVVPAPDETDAPKSSRCSESSVLARTPTYRRSMTAQLSHGTVMTKATVATKATRTPRAPKRAITHHNRMGGAATYSSRRTARSSCVSAELRNVRDGDSKTLRQRLLIIVENLYFDYAVTVFILMNGALVGLQTDWMARKLEDVPPAPFQVLEWIFGIVFTVELGMRLFAYRWTFFYTSAMGWNLFDLVIVMLQWIEIFLELMAAGLGVDFSLLRILRIVRVIRLARALRLIGELRTIVSSIAGSMKSLLWTGVLLFMIVYVLGVGFTQVVLNSRIAMEKNGQNAPHDLEYFWGHLVSAIFSLFESISGGLDWDDAARPLIDNVGPECGVIFALYIVFTVLAMLNVVTGVFIDSVMKNASAENELRIANRITHLFNSLDVDSHGEICWEQFEKQLDKKEMKEFFKTINVDISHAQTLFELLDMDESGEVNSHEFVDGCLRIWAPAKGSDIHMIRNDINRLARVFQDLDEKIDFVHLKN